MEPVSKNNNDLSVSISKNVFEVHPLAGGLSRVEGLVISIDHALVMYNGYIALDILKQLEMPDAYVVFSFKDCLSFRTYFLLKAGDLSKVGPIKTFEILKTLENLDFVKLD